MYRFLADLYKSETKRRSSGYGNIRWASSIKIALFCRRFGFAEFFLMMFYVSLGFKWISEQADDLKIEEGL
jgi:hypothetical protein